MSPIPDLLPDCFSRLPAHPLDKDALAKAVTDAGLRLDFQAPNPKTPSMVSALDAYLTENNI